MNRNFHADEPNRQFMGRLESHLLYYRDGRIKKSLGWLSPMEYRRKLGYA